MQNPGGDFTQSLAKYGETIITKLEIMEKHLIEIQKDLHIQTLAANTKLEHTHILTNGALNGFGAKIEKMAKDIEEIKKSKK